MFKKRLILLVTLLLVLVCLVQTAFAVTSEITVEFTEGDAGVLPVDPDDPSQPLDPDEGEGTGESGPLALNYVSLLAFGPQKISATEQTHESITMKPFVQVTDLRGTGDGWQLRATAGPFVGPEGETLAGAVLKLTNGEALSAQVGAVPPVPNDEIVMPANGTTEAAVFTAAADTQAGMGTWISRWYPSDTEAQTNDNVTLTVPAVVPRIGAYQSTVTWRLVDAP